MIKQTHGLKKLRSILLKHYFIDNQKSILDSPTST